MMPSVRVHLPTYWPLYALYALLLTAVLLYFRFPAAKFRTYCMQRFEQFLPGTECTLGPMEYDFPLSLRINGAGLAESGRGQTNFLILDRLILTPDWRHPGTEFTFSGTAYSGNYKGRVRIDRSAKQFSFNTLEIDGFDLSRMSYIRQETGREVTGILGLTGSYNAPVSQPLTGSGLGKLGIHDGAVHLSQAILGLESIELKHGEAEWTYSDKTLQLAAGKLRGTDLHADFTGTVQLTAPWYIGEIELSGALRLQKAFLRATPEVRRVVKRLQQQFGSTALPFQINGTLEKPTFGFGTGG